MQVSELSFLLSSLDHIQTISMIDNCLTVQTPDSDSEVSDYLVTVCLIVTGIVIVIIGLCSARNTIWHTIKTLKTRIMGNKTDEQAETEEQNSRTDDRTDVQTLMMGKTGAGGQTDSLIGEKMNAIHIDRTRRRREDMTSVKTDTGGQTDRWRQTTV